VRLSQVRALFEHHSWLGQKKLAEYPGNEYIGTHLCCVSTFSTLQ
jgi:hypothetical protein